MSAGRDAPHRTPSDAASLVLAGIATQAELLRSRTVGSRELTAAVLDRIAALNPTVRAFSTVLAESALDDAAAADERLARRSRGGQRRQRHRPEPLLGVPIAVKGENDVAGVPTTFGGAATLVPAARDSEVVRRLRAAGAIVVGITAMSEFGLWPFTESAAHGYVRNPWDLTRSTLGSSGGTAAAVASGMVGAGIGGDAGGSIRLPSAACGLFGLKPQRGRVSTAPNPDLWRSLGTLGPLTRTVADSALCYDVICGAAATDRFSAVPPSESFTAAAQRHPGRLRVAVSGVCPVPGVDPDPEHLAAVDATATALASLGHRVELADPPYPRGKRMMLPQQAFIPQMLAGLRQEVALVDHPALLERRTKALWRTARALPTSAAEAAEHRGRQYAELLNQLFVDHDLLLQPMMPHRPPSLGVLDGVGAARAMQVSVPVVSYAGVWNIAGNPAASVPVGLAADGLPTAVQIVGRPHDEATVLAVARQLEQVQPWAQLRPPVS
jgi:amidase